MRSTSQSEPSGLEITIEYQKTSFDDHLPKPFDITNRNGSSQPLKILPTIFGVHYPIRFDISNGSGE